MKSNKVKRIVMAVLLIAAGYIWWGNLNLFQSSGSRFVSESRSLFDTSQVVSKRSQQVDYLAPRVNPFHKDMTQDTPQTGRRNEPLSQGSRPQDSSSQLSGRGVLKGLIGEKKTPQAIIVFNDGASAVLSIKDSIDTWVLSQIKENFVVFKKDKESDTLWLYGTKP